MGARLVEGDRGLAAVRVVELAVAVEVPVARGGALQRERGARGGVVQAAGVEAGGGAVAGAGAGAGTGAGSGSGCAGAASVTPRVIAIAISTPKVFAKPLPAASAECQPTSLAATL